jgi:hypothetical protein
MGEKRSTYSVLFGKPEGRRPLQGPGANGEDIVKMDLYEMGWEDVDCIRLTQNRYN